MADKRAYFKLDVGYMANPKVLTVIDESPSAALLHIASIGYAAQHLTDGVVPVKALLRMTGATTQDADLLFAAGLWLDGPTEGRATVHDYLKHQRSADEVKGLSEAGKRGAQARWNADRNAEASADRMRSAMADASESAMPREEREERERKEGGEAAATPATKSLALTADNRPDVDRICTHLADQREALGSKRPEITPRWRNEARLLIDNDGRTEEQVHACIRWLFTSSNRDARFWRTNVRSMPKLRAEYDRLRELADQPTTGSTKADANRDMLARAMERAKAKEAAMRGEGA